MTRTLLAALVIASLACARERSIDGPVPGATGTTATATAAASTREPDACRPCHAAEVTRWEASAHRLAARAIVAELEDPKRFQSPRIGASAEGAVAFPAAD